MICGYNFELDHSKSINEQNLLHETRIILSLIYRDYICDAEEKKILLEKDKKDIQKEMEFLREKYNIDFKSMKRGTKENIDTNQENHSNMYLIENKKEKWYQKIINKILEVLKK